MPSEEKKIPWATVHSDEYGTIDVAWCAPRQAEEPAARELTAIDVVSNPDAETWVQFWADTIAKHPGVPHDPGTMLGWFANAIQAGANAVENRLAKPLSRLADECHLTAIEKGFYEMPEEEYLLKALPLMILLSDTIDMLTALRKGVPVPEGVMVSDLDDKALFNAFKLLLIASEVVEAFHELVAGDVEKEALELADIAIRLFDYAAHRGIDLDTTISKKMDANSRRPRKHGARF